MPDTIKLQAIDAIATVIGAVTGIKSVRTSPPSPTEKDDALCPAVFMDDQTEAMASRNRLEVGRFSIDIYILIEGADYMRTAENYRGEIKKAIYESVHTGALHGLVLECGEKSSEKVYEVMETAGDGVKLLGSGGIVMRYDVAYLTKYRDPFTQAGY